VGSTPAGTTRQNKTIYMEKNEIRKALYKQNPIAKLTYIRKGKAYYSAAVRDESKPIPTTRFVNFEIPVEDMGDADFSVEMESKILQRWIMSEN
jgi:hypothetical protein